MEKAYNVLGLTSNIFSIRWANSTCTEVADYSKNAELFLALNTSNNMLDFLPKTSAKQRDNLIKNNKQQVVHVPIQPILSTNNKTTYLTEEIIFTVDEKPISFFTDVTELVEKRDDAKNTRERLELVLEGTRLGMWDWNPQTNDVVFDDRWADMLGVTLADLTQTLADWQDRVHPDDLENCFADITAHMENQTDFYENLHRMMHADGNWRYILDRGKVVERDSNNQPIRFTGTHTDVTELKLAELKAKDALLARNRFFANISHELRTPLHGILNLAELGLKDSSINDKDKALNSILASTKILTNIVNDILDFSKIDAGKLIIETVKFDLLETIQDLIKPLTQIAENKNIVFHSNIDEDILPVLIGDPIRLTQILNNLCANAIKFTEQGSVTLKVSIDEISKEQQTLVFEVIDTGIGISKQAQKSIFEEFHQADASTSRKYGGTGLGLSICTKLSEILGGKLSFKSQIGAGSTFSYKQAFEIAANQSLNKEVSPPIKLKDKTILIAEDNKVNQVIVKKMLENHNAKLVLAENGKACVDKFVKNDIDLILMDIQMPVLDGVKAAQTIRSLPAGKEIPIIAMTANTMKEDIEHYLNVGMNGYLTKPFNQEKLNLILNTFLSQ